VGDGVWIEPLHNFSLQLRLVLRQMNNGQLNFPLYENKDNVQAIPKTKIVEAYGFQKCPKLVEQVADDELAVRVNALAVLCDEFRNPYIIQGCAQAGIVKILSAMISDPDHTTRVRSSRALCLLATDANGLDAILYEDDVITEVLVGIHDHSEEVRSHVYECLYHVTRTMRGVEACVIAGVTTEFVNLLLNETDELKVYVLKTIHNTSKVEQGLQDALSAHAVEILIELLRTTNEKEIVSQTSQTLGILCYSDDAKRCVRSEYGVTILMNILRDLQTEEVRLSVTFALMAISSDDASKIEICDCDGVSILIQTLQKSTDRLVQLNLLKIVSSVAVYPSGRRELIMDTRGMEMEQLATLALETRGEEEEEESEEKSESKGEEKGERRTRTILPRTPHVSVTGVIKRLHDKAVEAGDNLMTKHAAIALQAVQWTP
jgi:hypothetical protein